MRCQSGPGGVRDTGTGRATDAGKEWRPGDDRLQHLKLISHVQDLYSEKLIYSLCSASAAGSLEHRG